MTSNRDRDDSDQAPLLEDQDGDGPDTRFAIDDSTIFDVDQEQEHQQEHPSNHNQRNKYPPLPPSYRDATQPQSFSTRHPELYEHLKHFQNRSRECLGRLPTPFSIWTKTRSSCYRIGCWPENRMVQVGIFLFFLWVLVIVAGPTFEINDGKSGREQAGKNMWGEDLSPASPPNPISGDGHIVTPATWEFRSCRTHRVPFSKKSSNLTTNLLKRLWGPPRRTICTSKTSFSLRVPASFEGTDAVFVYADPERSHAKDRGRVSGNVNIVVDESLPKEEKGKIDGKRSHHGHSHTKIIVDVKAKYDHDAQFLLDSTTVAQMGANLWDEGVGIYTWPLPPIFSFRSEDDPPLSFDITIRVPPGSKIPALRTEVAAMTVNCFTKTQSQLLSRSTNPSFSSSSSSTNLISRDESSPSSTESPYFGRFRVSTQKGTITSSSIRSISHIKLASSNGDVKILQDSILWGPAIRLSSFNGNLLIEDQVSLSSKNDIELKSINGNVLLGKKSFIEGGKIVVETNNGEIGNLLNNSKGKDFIDAEMGLFKANHTLNLKSDNGNIKANVEIQEPDKRLIPNLGSEHRFFVNVDVISSNGDIDLIYSKHQKGVSLNSNLFAKAAGKVSVKHNEEFEGNWEINGWKGSLVEKPKILKLDVGSRQRKFDVLEDGNKDDQSAGKKNIKGSIGWDPSLTKVGKEIDGFLPNGGSSKATSNGGVVKMKFD